MSCWSPVALACLGLRFGSDREPSDPAADSGLIAMWRSRADGARPDARMRALLSASRPQPWRPRHQVQRRSQVEPRSTTCCALAIRQNACLGRWERGSVAIGRREGAERRSARAAEAPAMNRPLVIVSRISPRLGSNQEDGRGLPWLRIDSQPTHTERLATTTRTPSVVCQSRANWVRVPSTPPQSPPFVRSHDRSCLTEGPRLATASSNQWAGCLPTGPRRPPCRSPACGRAVASRTKRDIGLHSSQRGKALARSRGPSMTTAPDRSAPS